MLKKGKDRKLVMMYVDYTTEFPLLDWNLSLYAVDSFVFDFAKKGGSTSLECLCKDHSQPVASVPWR